MPAGNFLRGLTDDGQYLPAIKLHSLEKIERHNYYADLFTRAMYRQWPQMAYVGLFAGAGRARVKATSEIVETSAMSVIRLPHPFTKYIFVDHDDDCLAALSARISASGLDRDVTPIHADVNAAGARIREAMPAYGPGNGLLSFCFVDPFSTDFNFDVLRQLSAYRMDVLVLLMLGLDARVNFRHYLDDVTSTRLGDLVDNPNWRTEYQQNPDTNIVRFFLKQFDDAMVRIGYLPSDHGLVHPVKAHGTGVLQYMLAFYSKHETGRKFWKDTLSGAAAQIGLDL